MSNYDIERPKCTCETPSGSEYRRCVYCKEKRAKINAKGLKLPNMKMMEEYHHNRRADMSDVVLLFYFKAIRWQCKWDGRQIDTLLEYINELEYRGLKYRL